MQFQSDINKSGLTFSFQDVNFDSNSLNLVPILLETPETEFAISDSNIKQNDILESNVFNTNSYNEKTNSNFMKNNSYDLPNLNPEVNKFNNFNVEAKVHIINDQQSNLPVMGNYPPHININTDTKSSVVVDHHEYEPVTFYWFYCVIINGLAEWKPFSLKDSNRIELKFCQYFKNRDTYDLVDDCVPTDGGRYDVFIRKRQKTAVYWEEPPMEIRRASWFYRPEDETFYLPYSESDCAQLESKFKHVLEQSLWHQPIELDSHIHSHSHTDNRCVADQFVFHSPHTMVQYRHLAGPDAVTKGRIVYRGIDAFRSHLSLGESDTIDHVLFVIHGIGPVCDLAGRGIVQCVTAMRTISQSLQQSNHFPLGHKGRLELIPVLWHHRFHSDAITIDRDLSRVTLQSVPKLRRFTNSTLVDVLCYSSPAYCQSILAIVASEMNRLRHLFVSRNPQYDGTISIAGHSLGSMIALDLVALQDDAIGVKLLRPPIIGDVPQLQFDVGLLFALGSPISLLLGARGLSFLGEEFRLERCKALFNIFHPLDPVAYRIEPMLTRSVTAGGSPARPVVIPHHKGRKRLHLELKENLTRVGNDIKSRLVHTLRSTWNSLQEFASSHKEEASAAPLMLADDGDEMMRVLDGIDVRENDSSGSGGSGGGDVTDDDAFVAQLNDGRRVDYVLQEAPLESFNDYLFALGSHSCYWDSEDTILMMLKEIYHTLHILPTEPQPPLLQQLSSVDRLSSDSPVELNDLSINSFQSAPPPPPPPPPPPSSLMQSSPPLPPPSLPMPIPMMSPHSVTASSVLPQTFQNVPATSFFIPDFTTDESVPDRFHSSAMVDMKSDCQSLVYGNKSSQQLPQKVNIDPSPQYPTTVKIESAPVFAPVGIMGNIDYIDNNCPMDLPPKSLGSIYAPPGNDTYFHSSFLNYQSMSTNTADNATNFLPIHKSQTDSSVLFNPTYHTDDRQPTTTVEPEHCRDIIDTKDRPSDPYRFIDMQSGFSGSFTAGRHTNHPFTGDDVPLSRDTEYDYGKGGDYLSHADWSFSDHYDSPLSSDTFPELPPVLPLQSDRPPIVDVQCQPASTAATATMKRIIDWQKSPIIAAAAANAAASLSPQSSSTFIPATDTAQIASDTAQQAKSSQQYLLSSCDIIGVHGISRSPSLPPPLPMVPVSDINTQIDSCHLLNPGQSSSSDTNTDQSAFSLPSDVPVAPQSVPQWRSPVATVTPITDTEISNQSIPNHPAQLSGNQQLVNVFQPASIMFGDAGFEEESLWPPVSLPDDNRIGLDNIPEKPQGWLNMETVPELPCDNDDVVTSFPPSASPALCQSIFGRTSIDCNRQFTAAPYGPQMDHMPPTMSPHSVTQIASGNVGAGHTNWPEAKPKSKPKHHDLPMIGVRRTPSPATLTNQNIRNSPKISAATSIFNSKPLVPQSGKLFQKK